MLLFHISHYLGSWTGNIPTWQKNTLPRSEFKIITIVRQKKRKEFSLVDATMATAEEGEVVAEVEAVQAVYGDDCVVIDSYPPHLRVHIKPRTADVSSQQVPFLLH